MHYKVLTDTFHTWEKTEGGRAALCKMIEDRIIEQNVRLYAEACQDFGLTDFGTNVQVGTITVTID